MSAEASPRRAAATAGPIVHLYTVCWDEADMLGFFFRHYDPWVTRYVVYDDGSADGSREILAAHPRVELRSFDRSDPDSFVLSHKAMQDHAWKESRGAADWVVITAIDEHLHVAGRPMAAYLAEQARAGTTLVPALGFDMNAPHMPADRGLLTETVTRGRPRIAFNKLSLFRPDAIAETGFGPGRHAAEPTGRLVLPERDAVMLWHYKHLGFERNAAREAAQALRLGRRDVAEGYGQHYLWSRARLRSFWDEMEAEATDLAVAGFSPEQHCKGPLWWRAEAFAAPAPAPKVSVLIKAYNHAPYVRQTVESVLDQSFSDFEIVATDDGSDDGTLAVLRSFDDPRIDVLALPKNRGISAAMNATIARARGPYLAILNSDDWALPGRLARQVAFLDANPEIDAVFGMPHPVDERGAPTEAYNDFTATLRFEDFSQRTWLRQFFFEGNCFCAPTAMVRRSAYDRVGPYDPRLTNLQDLDMWVRMAIAGCRFHVLPDPLTAFRIRDGNANASAPGMASALRDTFETIQILQHYAGFDAPLFDAVFGPGSPAHLPADASIPARLGELALTVARPSHRFFGLTCLHAAAAHPEAIGRLRALAGSIDLFGRWTLAEREDRIGALGADLQGRDARISALDAALEARAAQIAVLDDTLQDRDGRIFALGEALEERDRRVAALDGALQARDGRIAALGAALEANAAHVVACERLLDDRAARLADLGATVTRREARIAELERRIAALAITAGSRTPDAVPHAANARPAGPAARRRGPGGRLADRIPSLRARRDHARVASILDPDWYRARHPDIGDADPVTHYLRVGAAEGRAPHPLFDPAWYARSGSGEDGNPVLHFIAHGHAERRDPHPLFDLAWYLRRNPDLERAGYNGLVHYITHGAREGRSPHPLFDVAWYRAHNRGGEVADPLVHYVTGRGTDPHPLFDDAFYRAAIPDLDARRYPAALTHYVACGAAAGFDPNPSFASSRYLDAHETLRTTGENPLVHYLRTGLLEGRDPHPPRGA